MSEGGVRTRTRAEVSRRGSSASARTGAPARDAVAFSRALALRLVFDTGAVAVLDGYRRRVKAVSKALRRRGHRRLGALVRDENVARVAAVTCLAAATTALYVSRNKQRWAREREMRSRRAALRSQLAGARSYDEFIVVAHRMERLEERFATDPDSFFDDESGSGEHVPSTTTKQAQKRRSAAVAEASWRSSRDADAESDSDSDSRESASYSLTSFARFMKKRFFGTRFFPSSNEGAAEPHDASDARRVSSLKRSSRRRSFAKKKKNSLGKARIGTTRRTTKRSSRSSCVCCARGARAGTSRR